MGDMILPPTTLTFQKMLDTMCTIPWSVLKHVEQTLLWSVPSEPKGPQWADNVFTALKLVSSLEIVDDESTDGCSSGMFSSDEDADWSSDEVSFDNYSDEETTDLLMLDVYQGERWFWSPPSSMNSIQSYEDKYETASQRSADLDEFGLELSDKYYRRPTMYAIPSVDFKSDGVIDTWVNRYGSSKDDFTYVPTVPDDDDLDNGSQDSIVATGFYIPQL